ncbi:signal peptidase [Labedella gwakjiensis]|uniref:Signal peptidase I n=1 Tax=Labedella gwakjiensis TaxID=390269 RepID=A0A2P8GUL6_9MICO|nr:signal peptidase I [Labedella gwakjiensis]PSL37659.1 signal peptidase [Labedella gwakjiensis]RUQ87746.1 signal peptidase I [Labedella gwakjiensis]
MSHTFADGPAVVVDDHDGAPEAQTIGVVQTQIRIAGIVGGTVLACVAIGWIFGLSVLVFATGSMAPTMPAGTAAIVERIDASTVKIGDVVTVPRPGQTLPVTHRVVSVSTVDGDTSARSLVLRGDANDANDREPYVVEQVERVLVAVPGAGRVIGVAQSPFGVGLAAAVVVMGLLWSFWPAQRRNGTDAEAGADDADAPMASDE